MKTLQNFFKTTVAIDWAVGTGKRYVTTLPTPTSGWLVVSPNNSSLREIVAYDVIGTDGTGNFITITARGVGGTTEQTHSVNEPVRMNITAEHWADIYVDPVFTGNVTVPTPTDGTDAVTKDYADGLAIAGSPDAGVATKGIGKTSVAPASASNPIFVGDNDPRVPTQDENDALVGTSGTPSTSNPYATKATTDLKVSQSGAEVYASAGGTANAITITLSPVPSAYTTGMKVVFKATATNTGATTINVNSLGVKTIKKAVSADVVAGDIVTDGTYELIYDGTNFQIVNPTNPFIYSNSSVLYKNTTVSTNSSSSAVTIYSSSLPANTLSTGGIIRGNGYIVCNPLTSGASNIVFKIDSTNVFSVPLPSTGTGNNVYHLYFEYSIGYLSSTSVTYMYKAVFSPANNPAYLSQNVYSTYLTSVTVPNLTSSRTFTLEIPANSTGTATHQHSYAELI